MSKNQNPLLYSERNGFKRKFKSLPLETIKPILNKKILEFEEKGLFAEYFGFYHPDYKDDRLNGIAGEDIPTYLLLNEMKDNLWPFSNFINEHDEIDLFDTIEILFKYVSLPLEANYVTTFDGGYIYFSNFDSKQGQLLFKDEINKIISKYKDGYELTTYGEIVEIAPSEFTTLLDAKILSNDDNLISKIENAKRKYRHRNSNAIDRDDAVRDLSDALEILRPKIKKVLMSKDESDLFDIANNFGIRHHNSKQKNNYDKTIWRSWMFYYYLATIQACLHLIEKQKNQK
ncbi:MAG: hypothetical protein J0L55_06450 [Caulobacterales bacterium]|nr:hypothetical protein [Caulobacterales bacterium]MCA0371256.1 hypothetical protein [Pseudomonadota bacterium]